MGWASDVARGCRLRPGWPLSASCGTGLRPLAVLVTPRGWPRRGRRARGTKSEGAGGPEAADRFSAQPRIDCGRLDRGREPQRVNQREHLGGDGVDHAVDDADDGDREATGNLRNGKHHVFFLGIGYVRGSPWFWRPVWVVLCSAKRCSTCVTSRRACGVVGDRRRAHATRSRAAATTAVARSVRAAWELLATVPDELMGSAGKATEERRQLGGDTKNGAFDDADDRGDEAAEKGSSRHESTSLSGPPSCRKVLFVAATATYSSKHKLASDC
jgi:hypothetical protein